MDDYEQPKSDAQQERDQERAKLFLPVGAQVSDVDTREGEEDGPSIVDEIESLCMNCKEDGVTRLLLTKVPYFREVILMSFYCEHCHFKNTEIQSAGEIQKTGTKYTLHVESTADMQRQVVKSDTAVVRIEELDIEIPSGRGRLTNVEGILSEILQGLESNQPQRKKEYPELYEKLEEIVQKLLKMMIGSAFPYTITLDDTAGNSWIEPSRDDMAARYTRKDYARTPEQNASLGLSSSQPLVEQGDSFDSGGNSKLSEGAVKGVGEINGTHFAETGDKGMDGVDILEGHMYTMPCECPGCTKPAAMNMQMVNIPYFKQVIITAVVCLHCNYKTNEVKTGGAIPPRGRRIFLKVKNTQDLRRDILKSETCLLKVPECTVEVQPGTMGGRFTTVEGLLTQMRDDLRSSIFDVGNDASGSDSITKETKAAWDAFFAKLDQAISGEITYTIIMEDPLSNSYVQSFTAPERDPQIREEEYDRTEEEEDDLGISHMKTLQNADGEYVKEEASERLGRPEDDRTQGDATAANKWGHFTPATDTDTAVAQNVDGEAKSAPESAAGTVLGKKENAPSNASNDKLAAATAKLDITDPAPTPLAG